MGFQLVLFLILLCFHGIQVKATVTSSIHQEKEMEKEADSFAKERSVDQSKDPQAG